MRILIPKPALAILLCLALLSSRVSAAPTGPEHRVVVDRVEGQGGSIPRAGLLQALEAEDSVKLLSVRLLEQHKALNDGSAEGYRKLGERLDVVAILSGKVRAVDGEFRIAITVRDGKSGRALATLSFKAATLAELRGALRKEFWAALEPVLEGASEEPAEEPPRADVVPETESEKEPDQEPESEPEPKPEPSREAEKPEAATPVAERATGSKRKCDWVEIDVSGGTVARWFDYEREQRGALRAYKLQPVPQARLGLQVFPFSHRRCRLVSGIGFALDHEQMIGAHSELAGRRLQTLAFASRAELLLRAELGPLRLEPRVGYAGQYFEIEDDFVPDAGYHALRFGLDVGLRLGVFLVEIAGGYRLSLAMGELSSSTWFPEATGFGYDGTARLGLSWPDWFDVLGAAEFGEYSFALNASGPGAYPNGIAASAFDRYLRSFLLLRFHLR